MGDGIGSLDFLIPFGLGFGMLGGSISVLCTPTVSPAIIRCGVASSSIGCGGSSLFMHPSPGYEAVSLCCEWHWTSSVVQTYILLVMLFVK